MKLKELIVIILFISVPRTYSQDFEWMGQMGGPGYDGPNAVQVDGDGNIYSAGYFMGTADFDPGEGIYELTSVGEVDVYITKSDASGTLLWAKAFGGLYFDMAYDVAVDSSGNVYIAGYFNDIADFDPGDGVYNITSLGIDDAFLWKLDTNGNFIWAVNIGGADLDIASSVIVDNSDNVIVAGGFTGTVDFDPGEGVSDITGGGTDVFVWKLDPNGNFLFAKNIGGTGEEFAQSIAVDESDNIYLTGNFSSPVADFDPGPEAYYLTGIGLYDIFICKLNPSGEFIWAKSFGSPQSDLGLEIISADGDVYTAGYFAGTIDFDPGDPVFNLVSAGYIDGFVLKLGAESGDFIWAKNIGGEDGDYCQSLDVDSEGNVYVAGWFYGTADFNPGEETFSLTSAGEEDAFICKLDPSGSFAWAGAIGGSSTDAIYTLIVDDEDNIYTSGYFYFTPDFDPGEEVHNASSTGDADIFIVKLAGPPLAAENNTYSGFTIYPNPVDDILNLKYDRFAEDIKAEVIDITGKRLQFSSINSGDVISLNVSGLPTGTYFVKIYDGAVSETIRFVKK